MWWHCGAEGNVAACSTASGDKCCRGAPVTTSSGLGYLLAFNHLLTGYGLNI